MTYKQVQKAYDIQGRSTVLGWLRKYGNLDWSTPNAHSMKTPNFVHEKNIEGTLDVFN